MSAIEYDIRTEATDIDDASRTDDLENMRPLPRISVRITRNRRSRHRPLMLRR